MKVHDYIKFAAVVMLIVLTVVAFRREHKHPLLVTKVSEIVVMTAAAHAEEVEPQKVIAVSHRKVIVEDVSERRHPRKSSNDDKPAAPKVEHKALGPWTLQWSCSKVKWAASTFSRATLETMRVASGVAPLTAAEKQQAKECIEGKRS